ncbi:hypothetical protein ACVWYG_003643 [Pedobacter sp. UYEF25]
MEQFKTRITTAYGKNIVRCSFVEENLMLVIVEQTVDFEEFLSAVRDTVRGHVTFKHPYTLFLLQSSDYQSASDANYKQALVEINN